MDKVRTLLIALSAVCAALFGGLFVLSVTSPGYVEQVAKDVIRYQVEREVHENVDAIDAKFMASKAGAIVKRLGGEIAQAKLHLSENLPGRIAAVIAEMRDLDCECRKKIERNLRSGFEWRITSAAQAQERLGALIRTQYMETSAKLTREFRIFTGTNALVFVLFGVAALVRRRVGLHLLPVATVLLLATVVTSYLYLFNQNWLHTIVFSHYVGLAFVGYLGAVFAALCDLFFNRARITTKLLNWTFQSIGSSLQVVPC